jgi:hypothetical protein
LTTVNKHGKLFTVQTHIGLPKTYLSYPKPFQRVSKFKRIVHSLKGLALFPFFLAMAYFFHTPGLSFRVRCIFKGVRAVFQGGNLASAYGLLVAPLDSVRYFEFDFMWGRILKIMPQSYLDISSPRLLPLMVVSRNDTLIADLINPDKKDLPRTISLARSFGVYKKCRFHANLIEDAALAENSFDLVTSMSVLEHIPDDKGAIQKIWDLLKPGGVLLISVPCAATASEEYTNLNDYELIDADENGFVFWQRYYDEKLMHEKIFSITGLPRHFRIYGEKKAGNYQQNVVEKRSNPFYPYWQEPYMMGTHYEYKDHLTELKGTGVIAMEFVKPQYTKEKNQDVQE